MKILHKMALSLLVLALSLMVVAPASAGVTTANGWYEGMEIYYTDQGPEKVTELGVNQIYLIGGDRKYQANVVLFIPGEAGYTPHWNVNVVHTAPGKTVQDIVNAGFASDNFVPGGTDNNVLFEDVEDILDAQSAGLVTIEQPGVVVLCPIFSEMAADAPGNNPRSETFEPLNLGSTF
jgi:hypothetical protein